MAANRKLFFTDEELLDELKKLGYSDVSPEIFQIMKDDLSKLVEQEQVNLPVSDTLRDLSSHSSSSGHSLVTSALPGSHGRHNSESHATHHSNNELKYNSSARGFQFDNDAGRFVKPDKMSNNNQSEMESTEFFCTNDNVINTADDKNSEVEENTPICKTESPDSSSSSFKTIKRKVLRHRDGRVVITEQLLPISNFSECSYSPSESTKSNESSSSDELSFQSNGSTGSLINTSSDPYTSKRSTSSLASTRSAPPHVGGSRRKKSDPVAMYSYYKKFWDSFKPPGEKKHDKLRWAVRDKMLDYNLT